MDLLDETRAKLEVFAEQMLERAKHAEDAGASALEPEALRARLAMLEMGQHAIFKQMAVICGLVALLRDGKALPSASHWPGQSA